jgi:hypothetical protein
VRLYYDELLVLCVCCLVLCPVVGGLRETTLWSERPGRMLTPCRSCCTDSDGCLRLRVYSTGQQASGAHQPSRNAAHQARQLMACVGRRRRRGCRCEGTGRVRRRRHVPIERQLRRRSGLSCGGPPHGARCVSGPQRRCRDASAPRKQRAALRTGHRAAAGAGSPCHAGGLQHAGLPAAGCTSGAPSVAIMSS